jgi:PKD repeat protein
MAVADGLLQFQQSNGGFNGYYDLKQDQTVTSSIDTDEALLGLISADLIPVTNQTTATQYLLSLQNPDGSFNLTSTISFDPLYSQGPDTVSITSLTLLALKGTGFTVGQAPVANALKFVTSAAAIFSGNGHAYAAALATLAFKAYDQSDLATASAVYLLSQQNSDGGFSDSSRSSYPESNALDTGWAAIALETQSTEEGPPTPINSPPIAAFSFAPRSVSVGVAVHFNATASHDSDNDQLFYNWTFGDGSAAQGISTTHTYANTGNYTVTLIVTDSGTNPGPLSGIRSVTITVQPTIVQNSPSLRLGGSGLLLVAASLALVAIIGVAFYIGRRTARRPSLNLKT